MGIQHEDEILLTTEEVAKYLGVGLTTVARLCERGVLVRRKVPRDRRLFVTLDSMMSYRQSDRVALRDLATKVSMLEMKINELLVAREAATGVTYLDRDPNLQPINHTIRKHHPGLFQD